MTFNDSILADKTTKLSESLNLSVSQSGLENLTMSESKKDQLKAAFLLFCKRDFVRTKSMTHLFNELESPLVFSESSDRNCGRAFPYEQ